MRNVMKLRHVSVLLSLLLVAAGISFTACSDDDDPKPVDVDCDENPEDPACLVRSEVDKYNVRRCPELDDGAHEVLRYNEGFKNSRNLDRMLEIYNKSYGADTLVHPGEEQRITGRFWSAANNAPGIGDGPEDEDVVVFREVDGEWKVLGEGVTDKKGNYEVAVADGEEFDRGDHRILSVLKADGTCVEHGVFVYEKGFETILTDIDATLTTLDSEMMHQMFTDLEYIPAMLDKADDMANLWNDKGYLMLYLSARPYDYLSWTRIWLREEGFPFGPAQTASGFVHGDVAATYKEAFARRIMEDLEWEIRYAYGNAFSDVDGYVNAGIPKADCFMVNESACPSQENAATPERVDNECVCYVGSENDACDKFDDLQETPYIEQDGVAYRGTVEISPNDSYKDHIEEHIKDHPESTTRK